MNNMRLQQQPDDEEEDNVSCLHIIMVQSPGCLRTLFRSILQPMLPRLDLLAFPDYVLCQAPFKSIPLQEYHSASAWAPLGISGHTLSPGVSRGHETHFQIELKLVSSTILTI